MASPAPPERIVSRANRLLTHVRRLGAEPAAYRSQGEVVLEGEHLCSAWAERGRAGARASVAIVSDTGWEAPAARALARLAARTVIVGDALMAGLSQLESPPAIAMVVALPAPASVLAQQCCLVLDAVQDPGNVGTLLR
ncbi:MAG: RNA methyltransferase, partial [Pseudomonadota bacterium]|nr:RNA methyltransferase [Pseudomonadota bacterium]